MKALWLSNSITYDSGFGVQGALFVPRIIEAGIEVETVATGAGGRKPALVGSIVELPTYHNGWGNDIILSHYTKRGAQVVISLLDPLVFEEDVFAGFPWLSWTPVDCIPVSRSNDRLLRVANWIWAMSKFGQRELQDAGFRAEYVPHGVDSSIFCPVDKHMARQNLATFLRANLEDKFIVMTVAANRDAGGKRKNFAGHLAAFKAFADRHANALLYLHTDPQGFNGEKLLPMAQQMGIADRVLFPPNYSYNMGIAQERLNLFYNAADLFMLLSLGEGFGIPIIEAQMAGLPVIVADNSAMTELAGSKSQLVDTLPVQASLMHEGSWWGMPLQESAFYALERAYLHPTQGNPAIRQSVMQYDADNVFTEYMLPALRVMEYDLQTLHWSMENRAAARYWQRHYNRMEETDEVPALAHA